MKVFLGPQSNEAGTKETANNRFSRGERGDAEKQPNSHSLTETRRHGEKPPSQKNQQPIARGETTNSPVFPPCLRERMAVGNFFLP